MMMMKIVFTNCTRVCIKRSNNIFFRVYCKVIVIDFNGFARMTYPSMMPKRFGKSAFNIILFFAETRSSYQSNVPACDS